MRTIFCSLFFLLTAKEIVGQRLPVMPPDLEFTIAGMVYPVDLNHNRKFTEEERCLLEAVIHNIQKVATTSSKCQWFNSSLAEIRNCGQAQLASSMAHDTLEELSYACISVEPEITLPISQDKACDHAVAIQHIHSLLLDDFQCKKTGVCERCKVLKNSVEKLPEACSNVKPHKQMMRELERRYTTNCASQPNASSTPTPSPNQYTIPADPDFNKPLDEKTKCVSQAYVQQLKDTLEGVSGCSHMQKFSEAAVKCYEAAGNKGQEGPDLKGQAKIVCAHKDLLPPKILSEGEKCNLNAQINYLQSTVDGDDRCSALSKHVEELKVCPTSVYAQYMLPHSQAQITANCPNFDQTDLSTTGAHTNQTSSTTESSSTSESSSTTESSSTSESSSSEDAANNESSGSFETTSSSTPVEFSSSPTSTDSTTASNPSSSQSSSTDSSSTPSM